MLTVKIDQETDLLTRCKMIVERNTILERSRSKKEETYDQKVVRLYKEHSNTIFAIATAKDHNGNLMTNETIATIKQMSYFDRLAFQTMLNQSITKQ